MDSDSSKTIEPVSKSQRKREAQALRELGRRLVALKPAQLDAIPLPANLREAVAGAQRITQRIARKRELGFVGKLLREVDPAPIEEALERLDATGVNERVRHHRVERWRDALLAGGDDAVQALVEADPLVDRAQLRQLLRKAQREAEADKPPAAARQLFKVLRELDQARELPADPPEV